ncbi:hypothetical protein JT358_16005 [Micrococcales bacterium 31B]|nr:hypothetical protein [Micrococcales bacterium 31B]
MKPLRGALAAALVLAASAGLAACTQPASPPPGAPGVTADGASAASSREPYTVATRDITVTYRLNGRTVTSESVVIAQPENTSLTLERPVGTAVAQGDALGTLAPEPAALASLTKMAESGTVAASRLQALTSKAGPVTAPVNGVVQQASGLTSIASPGIDALVDLTPLQFLRYQGFEFTGLATVETVFGQQRVPCQGIWLANAPASGDAAAAASDMSGGASATTGQLHCRLPADVETAPGLPLSVQLTAETVKAAVAVPSIYVGLDASGANYVVKVRQSDGSFRETPVAVGPTDGVLRIITSGLKAGDVLEARTEGS